MQNNKVNALEVAKLLFRAKFNWQNPLYLIHAVTARCNARCGFCAWNPDFYDGSDEMITDEVKQLYRDARSAGFVAVSMWGGEPLLRKDLGELAAYAKRQGLATHMVTNGTLLERKLDDVVPHFDRICISVDHPSDKHDLIRGIKGLYGKILSATLKIRSKYPKKKIVYNYTIQKANSDPAVIEEMAKVMKTLGVVGIFNAMRLEPAAGDQLVTLGKYNPAEDEMARAYQKVRELKKRGFPIVNSYTHIDKMLHPPMSYHCHWPKFMLPIEANGDVVDCMHWGQRPIANVRQTPFAELMKHPRLHALAGKEGEACHKCVSIHRIDISELWEGKMEPLVSWARNAI